jgi:hypothetical protein
MPVAPDVQTIKTNQAVDDAAANTLTESIKALNNQFTNRYGPEFNKSYLEQLNSGKIPHTELNRDLLREPGVNDASHKDTLRYSRLVDALNNKRFITPGQAGVRSAYAVGGRTGRSDSIDFGDVYKMDGIETAESRAQKRAEGYEAKQKGREIDRRESVKDQGPEFERLLQMARLAQAGNLNTEELRQRGELYDAQIANRYNLPFELMRDRYATQLGMSTQEYQAQVQFAQMQFATMLQRYIQYVTMQEIPTAKIMQAMKYATGRPEDTVALGMLTQGYNLPNVSPAVFANMGYMMNAGANAVKNPVGYIEFAGELKKLLEQQGIKLSNDAQKAVGNNKGTKDNK